MVEGPRDEHAPDHEATVAKARKLRRDLTPPEARLWLVLRQRPDELQVPSPAPGRSVRRRLLLREEKARSSRLTAQCHDMGGNPRRDESRDAWLKRKVTASFSIPAAELRDNLDGVLAIILASIAPPPCSFAAWSPSP